MLETMLPVILDSDFNALGVIDDYISFIWTDRYYDCGDFELAIDALGDKRAFIKPGYYVQRYGDDSGNLGIIEGINVKRDETGHEVMTIKGRFLTSLLERRIIATQTQVSGTVANAVKKLINENLINPTISTRKIPNVALGAFTTPSNTIKQQFTGKNLFEAVKGICEDNKCGLKMTFEGGKFVFSLYEGVDRSYNQTANPHVIFSDEYDNLDESEYEENYEGLVTDVLVAGEGEGTARKTAWASSSSATNGNSGLARYEVFQDARNASTNEGEIPEATYIAQLKQDGAESLTTFTSAFTGTVDFSNIVYGVDLSMGDICTVENTRWGIGINTRLVEIIESVGESGEYSIVPSFGA